MRSSRTTPYDTMQYIITVSRQNFKDTPSSSLGSNLARGTLQCSIQYIPLGRSDAVHAIGGTESVLRESSDVVPGGRLLVVRRLSG
jgi:hypothetical protein